MTHYGHDPRIDLETLRSEDLYGIASNEAAVHKDLALQILVERCSEFALKDDVAAAAQEFVLDHPLILKRINPATAVNALTMPGVIEVLDDVQKKRQALGRVVDRNNEAQAQSIASLEAAIKASSAAHDEALANEQAERLTMAAEHAQSDADITNSIADLNIATSKAIANVTAWLWREAANKIYGLYEAHEELRAAIAALRSDHDAALATLRSDHEGEIAAANVRLVLLERSAWKKLSDWARHAGHGCGSARPFPLSPSRKTTPRSRSGWPKRVVRFIISISQHLPAHTVRWTRPINR